MSALLRVLRAADSPTSGKKVAAERRISVEAIYDDHFAFVWRNALRLGIPRHQVEDVVQETFVIVHRRIAAFEGRASLTTWLFGILINVVRNHRRAMGGRREPLQSPLDLDSLRDPAEGPDAQAIRAQAGRIVERLLHALDDDKRAVFVLAELEQMSASNIASALGLPLNTVYSRLRLAREEFSAAAARHRARDEWRTR